MTADIKIERLSVEQPKPFQDAAIGLAYDLTNDGGWPPGASAITWQLIGPENSLATLVDTGGNNRSITPDVPGTYMVHLTIEYLTDPTEYDRSFVAVPDPATGLVPPGVGELGADWEDPDPTPTRPGGAGWGHAADGYRRIQSDSMMLARQIVAVHNAEVGTLNAGTIVKATGPVVWTGGAGGVGGSAPALAVRTYAAQIETANGDDPDDAGDQVPLYWLLEDIASGATGLAVAEGLICPVDTTDMYGGMPVWVDDDGSLAFYDPLVDGDFIGRQVGHVVSVGAPTDTPPGSIYFCGRPRAFEMRAVHVPLGETGVEVTGSKVGNPTFQPTLDGSGPYDLYFRITADANGDVYVRWWHYWALAWLGLWPDQDRLFRLSWRQSRPEAGTVLHLDVWGSENDHLIDYDLPTPGDANWVTTDFARGDLDLTRIKAAIEAGSEFQWQITATFGGVGAVNGDTMDFRVLMCGLNKPRYSGTPFP